MFHLFAYTGNITNGSNAQVNALTDQIFNITNNNFLPNQDFYVPMAMVLGTTINQARLISPSLRQVTAPQLYPVQPTLNPVNDPNYIDLTARPLVIRGGEELQFQATGSSTASTAAWGLFWAMDRPEPIPAKEQTVLYATSTTAAVANVWSDVTYTLADQIPSGAYALLASKHSSTNAIAHRWICDNEYFRPGMSSDTAITNRQPLLLPSLSLGVMGYFRNTSMPRLQVLCTSTDNSHTIYMKIARIAN